MHSVHDALQAAASRAPSPAAPRLFIAGGGGPLGSAVMAQLLSQSGWSQVGVLVDRPLNTTVRGLVPVLCPAHRRWHDMEARGYDSAVLVFVRQRHSNGRDDAFTQVQPADLLGMAQCWAQAGVRHLTVVTPHAPASLPEALRHGLANLEEQATTALAFTHVVWLRPTQTQGTAPAGSWLQRVAFATLAQLSFMIPQQDQPVRLTKLAELVRHLVWALADSPAGRRVVPAELLWAAAQTRSSAQVQDLVVAWLQRGESPQPRSAIGRM